VELASKMDRMRCNRIERCHAHQQPDRILLSVTTGTLEKGILTQRMAQPDRALRVKCNRHTVAGQIVSGMVHLPK